MAFYGNNKDNLYKKFTFVLLCNSLTPFIETDNSTLGDWYGVLFDVFL